MFSWSHSKLKDYETCPYRLTLAENKTPRASSPHTDAGIAAHKTVETFLRDRENPLAEIPPFPKFDLDFIQLSNANASPESPLAIDKQWNPAPWDTAWGRAILDAIIIYPDYVRIIDFKTGKPHVIAHHDQAQTYAAFAAAYYPTINEILVEFWYLTTGVRTHHNFPVKNLAVVRKRLTARALRAEHDTQRLPRPNKHVCGYCSYVDHCEYAPDDRITTP